GRVHSRPRDGSPDRAQAARPDEEYPAHGVPAGQPRRHRDGRGVGERRRRGHGRAREIVSPRPAFAAPRPVVRVQALWKARRRHIPHRGAGHAAVIRAAAGRARLDPSALKALPVELPIPLFPLSVITLKNRSLSTFAQRFIEQARAVTKLMPQPPVAEPSVVTAFPCSRRSITACRYAAPAETRSAVCTPPRAAPAAPSAL